MGQIQNQVARAISSRLPSQNTTGTVWALQPPNQIAVRVAGGAVLYGVRYVASYAPVVDDVVVLSRDARGVIVTGKLGASLQPDEDIGTADLYLLPRLDMVPVFTGTWQGKWRLDVDNECRFGLIDGSALMGCAYYGRVLQGSTLYSSDSYFLSIVRLPSVGRVPAKVTVGLLAGQAPTEAGPVVLDTVTGINLTAGAGMGDQAESLSIQFQGWEDRFHSGEAGGLALIHDATEPDHLTRVAGTYGCSMTVTGYPAWVL